MAFARSLDILAILTLTFATLAVLTLTFAIQSIDPYFKNSLQVLDFDYRYRA